jgi:hypothetical protein
MNRRALITGFLATIVVGGPAQTALMTHPNGTWDGIQFAWQKIGVDVYGDQPLALALELMGIRRNHRAQIIQEIEISSGIYTVPDEIANIARGHRYQAMVSGGITSPHPVVARNVVPYPDSSWSSTSVDVWRIQIANVRYVFGRPHGCNNWLLITISGATIDCRCRPDLGDPCS